MARLQLAQQVDDLRLHRHVERGGRLVEDEEAWLEDHGAGDGDALALAPGEFVWIAIAERGIQSHLPQCLVDETVTRRRRGADAVDAEAFADDLRDGHARRQRAERILEDDLHLAAQRPQPLAGHAVQLEPAEADPALARLQAEQGQAQRRLARAALAHHADRLALAHGETHAVDRLDVGDRAPQQPAADRKPHANVLRLHHDGGVRARGARHRARLGGEQAPGVGVTGRLEDRAGRARLDDLARAHHAHALGHLADDPEVVGDEQQRHAELRLQRAEQREDLGLDGDVERGGGLVGDEQIGLVGQRHRDHHALALAARELVRIGVQPPLGLGQSHQPQELQRPRARGRPGEPLVHPEDLVHLFLDRVQRVQRRHRLLEDHRDAVTAHPLHHGLGSAHELLALQANAPARMPRRRIGQELHDRQRRDRFA